MTFKVSESILLLKRQNIWSKQGVVMTFKVCTLFLWDINEQKNCQSFQCGFSYSDSLPNALTKRIFKFYRSVQDLPAKQHSQFSPDLVEMGWIGCAVWQANPKPIDRI